jgi:hypothetical protein
MSQEEFRDQIMKHQTEANKVFGGQHNKSESSGWTLFGGGTSPQKKLDNTDMKIFTEQNDKMEQQVGSKIFPSKVYKEQGNAFTTGALSQDAILEKAMMTERTGDLKIFKEQNDKKMEHHQGVVEKAMMTDRTGDMKIFKEQNDKMEQPVGSKTFPSKVYKEQGKAFTTPGALSQDVILEKAMMTERTVDHVKSFKEYNDKTERQVESKGFKEYKEQENTFNKKKFSPKALSQDAILANAMKKQQGYFF